MIKKLFIGICIPIIILGVIAVALDLSMGNVIEFASMEKIPNTNLYWYKYDIWGYINNLNNAFRSIDQFSLNLPNRQWVDLQTDFWEGLGNNLALILDYIILIINLILYPFRIGFYTIQIVLSVIGINTLPGQYENNPLKWLIDLTITFKNLQIPYI